MWTRISELKSEVHTQDGVGPGMARRRGDMHTTSNTIRYDLVCWINSPSRNNIHDQKKKIFSDFDWKGLGAPMA
jgi:hypothetical protein